MASVNTLRSLLELTFWQGVRPLVQERLIRWLAASQGEEADGVVVQIDLRANEAMQPMPIDVERMSEKADPTAVVGASQKDDHPARARCRSKCQRLGKRCRRGAASILRHAAIRAAAMYLADCRLRPRIDECLNRDQTLACQRPL